MSDNHTSCVAAQPLRGLRRYAASFFLSLLTMIFIVVGAAQAQLATFDFLAPSCTRATSPVLVLYTDQNIGQYDVDITAIGMVFDHTQQYSRQLCQTSISATIDQPTGLYHSSWTGGTPPSPPFGDVIAKLDDRIGAGRYKIVITRGLNDPETIIYLDLTDGYWADGSGGSAGFRNIVIEPCVAASDGAWVHFSEEAYQLGEDGLRRTWDPQTQSASTFHDLTYWHMVRNDPANGTFQRGRGGFIIDPSYRGPAAYPADPNLTEIPYGMNLATLDVDVEIRGDIVIPAGKTWTVTTDVDYINSPSVEQTQLDFNPGMGLNVQSGGTFLVVHSGPFGVIDHFSTSAPDKGGWRGIVGEPGATISLQNACVIGAEVGLTLEQTNTQDLLAVLIEDSKDIGLHVIDCSPQVLAWGILRSGVSSGVSNAVNVKIEGALSGPRFTLSSMCDAVQVQSGSGSYGGHGVEITASGRAFFEHCGIAHNEGNGFYIHETVGPYILDGRIYGNRNGVYVRGGSYWTSLRESRVYDHTNGAGIVLEGSSDAELARIAGWYHDLVGAEPTDPTIAENIRSSSTAEGLNCLWNNSTNVRSYAHGRFDLGSEYFDNQGVSLTLGGVNSITNPVSSWQGILNYSSFGGFRDVWWDANQNFDQQNNSSVDLANPLVADQLGCPEMGKRHVEEDGSMVADILLYRRTRGTMRLPEPDQPVTTSAAAQPVTAWLAEPYPNPFNPTTKLAVTVFKGQNIRLAVTDMLGREVAVPLDGAYEPGRYTVDFNAVHLPSGMYHLVLHSGDGVQSRRLLLTK